LARELDTQQKIDALTEALAQVRPSVRPTA
jgi:hypothetical protein